MSLGIKDGNKVHLMIKKSANEGSSTAGISKSTPDLYIKMEYLLKQHISAEETTKVIKEFKKVCFQLS